MYDQIIAGTMNTAKSVSTTEIKGDVFDAKTNLAHCISADGKMAAGIAKAVVRKFGRKAFRERVLEQKGEVGDAVAVPCGAIYVYNLITKEFYYQKPSYETLRKSLVSMRDHAVAGEIETIAMPRIGCGLDCLEWPKVRDIINDVFSGTEIAIKVFSLDQ